jgi:hypothetical protein
MMLRSSRTRKHDQEERDRSDSDEEWRQQEQMDSKGSVMDLKEHQKKLSSELAKHPNAGNASGSLVEGQKKRKGRWKQETRDLGLLTHVCSKFS